MQQKETCKKVDLFLKINSSNVLILMTRAPSGMVLAHVCRSGAEIMEHAGWHDQNDHHIQPGVLQISYSPHLHLTLLKDYSTQSQLEHQETGDRLCPMGSYLPAISLFHHNTSFADLRVSQLVLDGQAIIVPRWRDNKWVFTTDVGAVAE